jgi:Gram-negative bacterial TonB protein C-terminal
MSSAFDNAFFRLAFILLILSPATRAASAADEPYLVEYRAYNVALKGGDRDAAARHALAAWQAAEAALGDHRLTGILAFNYGRLIVFDDAEQASTSLHRAHALHQAGIADLSAEGVRVYPDYADFASGEYKRREADDLRESLEAIGTDTAAGNPDLAVMWLQLAAGDVADGRYRKGLESAADAEAAILSAAPGDSRGMATAIMLGAIARLVPHPREVEDVQAAHNELSRARRLFSPQKDLDTFDPLLAKVLAWNQAAGAALHSLGHDDYPDHEEYGPGNEPPPSPPLFERDGNVDCGGVEWLEREAPHYPRGALRRGTIGAVFMGYRLDDDLTIRDVRILAEVPVEQFSEYVLDAVKNWRAKALPSGGPACYENLTVSIQFAIET